MSNIYFLIVLRTLVKLATVTEISVTVTIKSAIVNSCYNNFLNEALFLYSSQSKKKVCEEPVKKIKINFSFKLNLKFETTERTTVV